MISVDTPSGQEGPGAVQSIPEIPVIQPKPKPRKGK